MPENRFTTIQGLSLLELLITISVISILVTSAAPSYLNWYQQTRLKSVARELTLLLRRAQHLAITQHTTHFVLFEQHKTAGIFISDAQSCNATPACSQILAHNYLLLSAPVALHSASFSADNDYTRFSASTGLADGGAGSVVLTAGVHKVKVIISGLGRVRTCALTEVRGLKRC